MARKKTTKSNKTTKTRPRIDLFGSPSLLFGENEATYNELFERVNEALEPADIFEEFNARSLADAMMDSIRFARLKPELLNANMHKGLERVLEPLCDIQQQLKADRLPVSAESLAFGWAAGDSESIDAVEERMRDANLSMDAVVADTLSYEMNGFEGIDRLAMNADARRHATLREVERRREAKREASSLTGRSAALDRAKANDNVRRSDVPGEIIDVEYKEVEIDGSVEAIERRPKAAGE